MKTYRVDRLTGNPVDAIQYCGTTNAKRVFKWAGTEEVYFDQSNRLCLRGFGRLKITEWLVRDPDGSVFHCGSSLFEHLTVEETEHEQERMI